MVATETRDAMRATESERKLLREMLTEKGFEVGMQVADVYYGANGRRSILLSEDLYIPEKDMLKFIGEYERRVSLLK